MGHIASFVAAGLLASSASALPLSERSTKRTINETDMIYSFENIPPSADLQWTPCYDKHHCANLQVPLDYANPEIGNTVIAFVRQDAANGTGQQDILFNPGGPGGSGVEFILSGGGDTLMALSGGKYNVVSFDPRGVNNSGIALTCFPDNSEAGNAFYSSLDSSGSLNEQYYQYVAGGQWCTEANNDTLARYAGTSAVVQDMMHFTELQAAQDGDEHPEEAQIWYIGASYGTVIGQTLAAMYPDRIGRIVNAGNVNGEDHYNGLTKTSIETADDGYEWFFSLCHEAGPKKCAFAGNSSSASDVKDRFNNLLARLEEAPVMVTDQQVPSGPSIITKRHLLKIGFGALYEPVKYWPYFAMGLDALEKDNATAWLQIGAALNAPADPGPFNYTEIAAQEAMILITATDAAGRYPIRNVDDYIEVAEEIEELSVYSGQGYAGTNVLINAGLKITPPDSQLFSGFKKTNTSNPILFINTSADPVTPTSSAEHMSQYFEGSIVLDQNSPGHVFTAVKSSCTIGYLMAYLEDATLPKEGTICETDIKPLVDSPLENKRSLPIAKRHLKW